MKIILVCPWKSKNDSFDLLEQEYLKRLRILQVEIQYLSLKVDQKLQILDFQNWINKSYKNPVTSKIYLLHERGKNLSTIMLKDTIEKNLSIPGPLFFIFGTAYGLSKEMLEFYPQHLSLSQLTFPHKIAKLVLVEQIYRTESIIQNLEYHHE
ncbi:MAG: 23S rRNA (pseudouridine(1915)-N(3))-methyltransferase RlmH [Bacteriovoracaceae bacterium]|nr:23S rRNA (pseudouridine(1915)-N(3))-methyltransferase RlmH [Bacteriovoracaceae bacterium]